MKHTPGPWYVPAWPTMRPPIVTADNQVICVTDLLHSEGIVDSRANARLIAAAPELVAHLIWIRDCARDIEEAKGRCMIALRQLEK